MNNPLQFDFSINKESKTITVQKAFAAPLQQVWAAWTESGLLDQWWGPKPYKAVTTSMDFREGGFWLYAMTGPDHFNQYSRADFSTIDHLKSYTAEHAFCDEEGKITNVFPTSVWTNTFSAQEENTLVSIVILHKTMEDLEKILQTGFKEGFTKGLENLDALLAT